MFPTVELYRYDNEKGQEIKFEVPVNLLVNYLQENADGMLIVDFLKSYTWDDGSDVYDWIQDYIQDYIHSLKS